MWNFPSRYRRFELRHDNPVPGKRTPRDWRPLVDRDVRQLRPPTEPDQPDFEPVIRNGPSLSVLRQPATARRYVSSQSGGGWYRRDSSAARCAIRRSRFSMASMSSTTSSVLNADGLPAPAMLIERRMMERR